MRSNRTYTIKQKYEQFFLGLLEGDGSIQVNTWRKRCIQFRVVIKLAYHPANYDMCVSLRDALGFMNVHVRNKVIVMVEDDRLKHRRFIALVERYGLLLTQRRYQYAFFIYCFKQKVNISEYDHIKSLGKAWPGFNHIKPYTHDQFLRYHWQNWLCGFTEAEGCFCVRQNGSLSFSIAQKDERELMIAIKIFFQIPNVVRGPSHARMVYLETYRTFVLNAIVAFYGVDPSISDKAYLPIKNGSSQYQSIGLLGYKQNQMQVFKNHLDMKKLKRIQK